ncbi:MAG: YbgA family protein [Candidatus Marinarcus sp.]|uniref:YbgA family protein n=1 Tax=Candidatus Marinarcus sp. TaxID=3100987 RepID=UPI003B009D8E
MKLGISSCLLGTLCRYDGGHSKNRFITEVLKEYFDFVPYCPEKMVFTTPREAIRLVKSKEERIKVVTSNGNMDVTSTINDISKELANQIEYDELCGFILKSNSPTCGMERVKVYPEEKGMSEKIGVGIFAQHIKSQYPFLPIEEEGRLEDAWLRENFLMQIFAYFHLFEFLKTEPSVKELIAFHTSYKYIIYAKSHKAYKELGNIVANHAKKDFIMLLELYKDAFLRAISLKGSITNTYNVLLHLYGYFKKEISKEEKCEILETLEEFKKEQIPLIAVIKVLNLYITRFDITYLKTQKFLNPYPKELALRSKIEAYK